MTNIFKVVNSLHCLKNDDVDQFLPIYDSIMNLSGEFVVVIVLCCIITVNFR